MSNSPATRPSLLIRIRDNLDESAWSEFVDIYAPLVYGFAKRKGLQDADATDLVQDVFAIVFRSISDFEYQPERGGFRRWLFTVTLNRIRRVAAQRKRQPIGSGDTGMHDYLAQQQGREEEAEWDQQHKMRLFHWAAEKTRQKVKPSTWEAFWQTAVLHKSPGVVAEELKMSVGTVYVAKNRMISRIRDLLRDHEEKNLGH